MKPKLDALTESDSMDVSSAESVFQKYGWAVLLAGLAVDWLRLRITHHAEERRQEKIHIARAISDLLQLRYIALSLPEFPNSAAKLVPKELEKLIPPDVWNHFDYAQMIPLDEELPKRLRKAVEEIAGSSPVLAYQLRDKERYLDFRGMLSRRLSSEPGSQLVANRVTAVLDKEAVEVLEDTLALLAKAHSTKMRFSVWRALRHRHQTDAIPKELQIVVHEQLRQVVAAVEQASRKTDQPPSESGTKQ